MSKSAYLLTILPGKFADIDEALSRLLKTRSGRALVSISTTRALLTSAIATEIEHCGSGHSLMDNLKGNGIYGARPVTPDEVVSLLSWREPTELALRPVLAKTDLVDCGYDWNVKRTRLVEAWEQIGGAAGIDWGDVLVGQIDTGYTEHPCLGWKDGRSPFVRTDIDRNFFYEEVYGEMDFWWEANTDLYSARDPITGAFGGHGTRTASILAGFDERAAAQRFPDGADKTFRGFYGAAPKVPHVPIRLSNSVWINNALEGLGERRRPACLLTAGIRHATVPGSWMPPHCSRLSFRIQRSCRWTGRPHESPGSRFREDGRGFPNQDHHHRR
jgi:hypothetical protein